MWVDGKLVLSDGTEFRGISFGAEHSIAGEVVFNTGMVGYPEAMTDPSYKGQILALTYPLIGNYGVPAPKEENGIDVNFESGGIRISALIVSEYSQHYSHWNAGRSLSDWLKGEGVPALYGIDTRRLTKMLREKGAMLGKVVIGKDVEFYDPNADDLVARMWISGSAVPCALVVERLERPEKRRALRLHEADQFVPIQRAWLLRHLRSSRVGQARAIMSYEL